MDPFWFIPEPYRSMLQPGDLVSIIGFKQFRIERDGKELVVGTIVEPQRRVPGDA